MEKQYEYVIVSGKALPEVFIKVLEAKRLLEGRVKTVQEAVNMVGISRSAFYKYRDMVFEFFENSRGRTLTFAMNMDDVAGLLSNVLNVIAQSGANILTINQTIPINKVANVTVTIEIGDNDVSNLMDDIGAIDGVQSIKILARE